MALEEQLDRLTDSIDILTAALMEVKDILTSNKAPSPSDAATPTPSPTARATPAASEGEGAAPVKRPVGRPPKNAPARGVADDNKPMKPLAQPPDYEVVRKAVFAFVEAKGMKAAQAVLAGFGVTNAKALIPSQYNAVLAKFEESQAA
jgi:hypothetical protein